ncbi:4a-hydroxytetrahydrobiopterin dehydratase [Ascidiaceihabitans sp.]|jgi:4a-hydroxytetrahydrobiopterin dehydratase|nr:4a-hydroxytetrahydrobiopterin dehydratase [Ascidiaceihabitans sp.]HCI07709.1 4a-hydroxytetrahydrobiopterin dehydratase [Sulfitobacter sp.]MDA9136322.1 4a-hydroxytetrahydrobiopterin dehydratase [Ascidiaceihabitans sp.]MDB0037361.1 4a-hydroxytetrahydrobiopterin dehydratase [Ascidiaceihabitans sp.]MDB4073167.1 4a-hydroxytetrahydrobiopterin dehydratase [Ascidiaceihabitans sp.]MDB4211690.1 4a-hydroxytetrahydrobiopterin dehydratase [Ascidiaceihabitans sp.]
MMEKLQLDQRDALLAPLIENGWVLHSKRDALVKEFKFKSFIDAFGWMTRVAIWAEKLNHHPEWSNVYSRVHVTLITHDVDGLSDLDLNLARKMDSLFTI